MRTGRCPARGTSPYKELVSPKVPGLYGGQNHGCSSKLQNSVTQVFFPVRAKGSSSAQDLPPWRVGASALGWQGQPSENQSTRCHLLAYLPSAQYPFSHGLPFRRGAHTHCTPLCFLRQASVLAKTAAGSQGYLCFPSSLARSQCPLSQPVVLTSLL